MKLSIVFMIALGPVLLSTCSKQDRARTGDTKSEVESVQTGLDVGSCRKDIDKSDPNETPYLVCPGVAGYALIVRRVDAGRESIDVVDPVQRVFPLNYHDFVTRYMSTLGDKAEWRVTTRDGKQVPIALIIRVHAREDNNDPEKVTRTYIAIAKITPGEACVTDRTPEGEQPGGEIRNIADSAHQRQCAPPQPRMSIDGTVVR